MLTPADILTTLQTGNPVSIIRSGDGEGLVLRSNTDLPTYKECVKRVMLRQMGYEPTMGEVEQIRQNLITAYNGADIVGLPAHKNLDKLNKDWKIVESVVKPLCTTRQFTSTDVAYDMLYNGMLNEWLKDKPVINYIGCRDIDHGLSKFGATQINAYTIAPEAKFTSGYDGLRHYPDQYNKIERWMDKCAIEGNPCLVGAGVIGKIYCNWFRDRGGVAFDIGAVMDLWAGYSTRGPERGLDAVNNKYKL